MECGIVGLPGSGKTTIFNALTGSKASGFGGDGQSPNVGVANVPDPRLDTIATHIQTKRIVPATIQLVDIPGVPVGGGSARINKFMEHVRQVDAICQVVRGHAEGGPADPMGDIATMDTELVLADLTVADSAKDKAARTARSGDADAKARLAVLEAVVERLEAGEPVRAVADLGESGARLLKSYGLITSKPVLYVLNIGEDDLGNDDVLAPVRDHAAATGAGAIALCGKLEAELAELDSADRVEMLESLGLAEPANAVLARAVNRLLGLSGFYTAGDKEVRAWTIRTGATAPDAAGSIHSDIQRGFIRAECYHVDELVEYKTEKAIRDAGKLRSEGKSYVMQDGDVVHFLFNV